MPMAAPMMVPITDNTKELNSDQAPIPRIAAPAKKQTIVQSVFIIVCILSDEALLCKNAVFERFCKP